MGIDGFAIPNWADLSATGLLVVVVMMIFFGRLIPKGTHEQITQILRTALEAEIRRGQVRDEQLSQLLGASQRAVDALEAVQGEVQRDR